MTKHAAVKWTHGLNFTGTADSGFTTTVGGSTEAGEPAEGLSPMELVLVGLAGCTAMDVISILQKKRQDVTGFEVNVQGERAPEPPRVYTDIAVEYVVRGRRVDPVAVERSIELSVTKYCSVQAMLAPTVPIHHTYRIVEEGAAGA